MGLLPAVPLVSIVLMPVIVPASGLPEPAGATATSWPVSTSARVFSGSSNVTRASPSPSGWQKGKK